MDRPTPIAVAICGIAFIVIAFLAGPAFSPSEFSWLRHTVSEQASQSLDGAWIMRLGFVAYGFCTSYAAFLDRHTRPNIRYVLMVFGMGLIATAVWSNASIMPNFDSDLREDWIHSIASGIVGTAFASACALRIFAPFGSTRDVLAWIGLLASIAIPFAMNQVPDYQGLLQRAMFLISFAFVIREFSDTGRSSGVRH